MSQNPPGPLKGKRTVHTIKDRGAVYEQRFNTCGKANCKRCNEALDTIVGHGPYWYLCMTYKGRWVRLYLGVTLDTSRYRLPDGSLDWVTIAAERREKKEAAAARRAARTAAEAAAAAGESDTSPPAEETPSMHCYVCGVDMSPFSPARLDRAAANLCRSCEANKTTPEHHTAPMALPAPALTRAKP